MSKNKKETTTRASNKVTVSQRIILSFLIVSTLVVMFGLAIGMVRMTISPRQTIQKVPGGGNGYVIQKFCGDGTCDNNESCSSCPVDCGNCGDPNLVLWIPLDSNTNDASIYGNSVYCSFQSCPTLTTGPRPGQGAYHFDGTEDYLLVLDADNLDVDVVTLAAWIRPDKSGQRYARILSKENGTTDPVASYMFLLDISNGIALHLEINGIRESIVSDAIIPINEWTHVVATYDGGEIKIYFNGQLVDSRSVPNPGPIQDNDLPLTISNSQFFPARFFSGDLSDLRIYNRPLNSVAIQALYGEETVCIDGDEDNYSVSGGDCGPVDCDDNNFTINPGALEFCNNGVDDNCNGLENENCGPQFICDNDEDSYDALPQNSENQCSGNDCNDNNAGIHPDALDVCGDNIDQDCSGSAAACQACIIGNVIGLVGCQCDGSNYYNGYCCEDGWQSDVCSVEPSGPITISGISSSSLNNNQSYTINGDGFGVKNPVAPLTWDDFETHTNGTIVEGSYPVVGFEWRDFNAVGNPPPTVKNMSSTGIGSSSGVNAVEIKWETYSQTGIGWSGKGPYDEIFFSFKRYMDPEDCSILPRNHKLSYVYGTGFCAYNTDGTPRNDCPQAMIGAITPTRTNWQSAIQNYPTLNYSWSPSYSYYNTCKVWQRWDQFVALETNPPSSNDGSFSTFLNNQMVQHRGEHNMQDYTGRFDDIYIGNMFQRQSGAEFLQDYVRAYLDDVYIDDTQARIELCDQAVWNDSVVRHCELQIPHTIWNNNQIQFTAHQGSFADNEQNLYLFVIDSNGNVSNGHQVSF